MNKEVKHLGYIYLIENLKDEHPYIEETFRSYIGHHEYPHPYLSPCYVGSGCSTWYSNDYAESDGLLYDYFKYYGTEVPEITRMSADKKTAYVGHDERFRITYLDSYYGCEDDERIWNGHIKGLEELEAWYIKEYATFHDPFHYNKCGYHLSPYETVNDFIYANQERINKYVEVVDGQEFVNMKTKLEFRCKLCGITKFMSPSSIQRGSRPCRCKPNS